jgi:hypothetical protein
VKLKNYTSSVPAERTIARIEAVLAEAGASDIGKNYFGGRLKAISFGIRPSADSNLIIIRLPADVDAVYKILQSAVKRPSSSTAEKLRVQAERTAWKLMQDWVEVQMSLIHLKQAELLQVFLPYVWNGECNYYTALKEQKFAGLLPAPTD